jgi:hypothetical protein
VAPSGAQSRDVKIVGSKIFVKKGEVWTDAGYQDSQPSIHLQYASEAYFQLLAEDSGLGKYFALGNNVLVHYKGELYSVQDLPAAAVETTEEPDLDEEEPDEKEPSVPELWQNYPNPFNPDTWIPYKLVKNSDAAVKIYGVNGKLVRTLKLGHKMAGSYLSKDRAAYWDGKNSSGEEASSGVYFYIFEAGEFRSMKKMILKK